MRLVRDAGAVLPKYVLDGNASMPAPPLLVYSASTPGGRRLHQVLPLCLLKLETSQNLYFALKEAVQAKQSESGGSAPKLCNQLLPPYRRYHLAP